MLLQYVLRPLVDPEPTNWSHIYASWWTEEYYNEDWVLQNYEQPKKVETETPKDEYVSPVEANLLPISALILRQIRIRSL